jgi:hypothetical protein
LGIAAPMKAEAIAGLKTADGMCGEGGPVPAAAAIAAAALGEGGAV